MMKKIVSWLLTALLTGSVVFALWFFREGPAPAAAASTPVPVRAAMPASVPATPAIVDAGLAVDASGHLVVNADTRYRITALLGSDEKMPDEATMARARNILGTQLKEPALSEALALLDNTVAYHQASRDWAARKAELPLPGDSTVAAALDFQHKTQLRKKYLGNDASKAMFGDEEAVERYQLARQQLMQMNGLSAEQKDEQLALLYQQLPDSAQAALKNTGTAGPQ